MEVLEIDLGNGAKGVDWHPFAESLKTDAELAPHLEKIPEKDVTSLIKSHVHLSRRMGNAINLPGKDAKPEEIQALRTKLYGAGVFTAPPEKPEGYEIKAPEKLPAGVTWNEERATKTMGVFHKLGLTKDQAQGIMAHYTETVAQDVTGLMTERETGITALKAKWAGEYDKRAELASRGALGLYQKVPGAKDFMDRTGLGNDPAFIEIMYEIGLSKQADSGFLDAGSQPGAAMTEPEKEANDIIRNQMNPKFKLYWGGDKPTMEYVQGLYAKAHPGTTEI